MTRETTLRRLSELHNEALDARRSPVDRMMTLWQIGELLRNEGVQRPHAYGLEIQALTNGLITRAVIFRAAKARAIWSSQDALRSELSGLRSVQYFYDSLALLDPKSQIATSERRALLKAAATLDGKSFRAMLISMKATLTGGRLGTDKRTKRGRDSMMENTIAIRALLSSLEEFAKSSDGGEQFRVAVPDDERSALSNMTIALASVRNLSIYKANNSLKSNAELPNFRAVYELFARIVGTKDDRERARLRSLINGDEFQRLASVLQALRDDASRERYLRTSGFSVSIPG
jgi:hypothetical protein